MTEAVPVPPAVAPPAPVPVPPPVPVDTGHGAVDGALARLGELGGVPVDAHADVYEGVHQVLRDTLGRLDEPRPGHP